MFTNLKYLNFGRSSIRDEGLYFCMTRPTVISSNLLELHVCLHTFCDCLYLLDGHFNQLRTLYVDVALNEETIEEICRLHPHLKEPGASKLLLVDSPTHTILPQDMGDLFG